MKQGEFTEANRRMWNVTAGVHEQGYVRGLLERIAAPDYSTFDALEQRLFADIGLPGKRVVQLCCNNGRELIAVKKAGAARCVGFDISDGFIAQANSLAVAAGVDVEFVRSDVYAIDSSFDAGFDLVYITIGAFGWLPDLEAFFDVIARLMAPGAQLFVYEMHPILNMFDPSRGLEVDASYFQTEPDYSESEPDYLDPSKTVEAASYWFAHTLSDVIGGLPAPRAGVGTFRGTPARFVGGLRKLREI